MYSDQIIQAAVGIANAWRGKATWTAELMQGRLAREHDGDCIQECYTCWRCLAESYCRLAIQGYTPDEAVREKAKIDAEFAGSTHRFNLFPEPRSIGPV